MVIEAVGVDPRVRRTRKLIQQAFFELLSEQGFQAITVQSVTDRATVNRSTFYAHFTDKYNLIDSFIREQIRDVLRQSLPDDAPVTRAHLQAVTRVVCEYLATFQSVRCRPTDQEQFEPLIEAAVQDELYAFVTAWFARLPEPTSPPEIPTSMAAAITSWTIFGAGMRWSRDPEKCSVDDFAWQVVVALTKGVPGALGLPGRLP